MSPSEQKTLSELFGSYKAEWLQDRIFDFFTMPTYFPELQLNNPCVLQGARGTGKTTVLKGLSFEGQWALQQRPDTFLTTSPFFGIYYRIDTNRVAAFQGLGRDEQDWQRYFAHYLNLVFCELVTRFLVWAKDEFEQAVMFTEDMIDEISTSLCIEPFSDSITLLAKIQKSKVSFEAQVNNLDTETTPRITLQGAPIESLLRCIKAQPPFKGKFFFFLIDEYENLLDFQQEVVNTLIKHTTDLYTFKIGVRELGEVTPIFWTGAK